MSTTYWCYGCGALVDLDGPGLIDCPECGGQVGSLGDPEGADEDRGGVDMEQVGISLPWEFYKGGDSRTLDSLPTCAADGCGYHVNRDGGYCLEHGSREDAEAWGRSDE